MAGGLTRDERPALDRALRGDLRRPPGIGPDPASLDRDAADPRRPRRAARRARPTGRRSRTGSSAGRAGSLAHLFAGGAALPLDRRLLVIGLAALADPEVRAVAQLAALGLLWDAVRRDLAPKLIVVDEAWKVMRQPAGAEFIEELARSARHYHAGLQLATQDIVEFLRSDFGESIVKQSDLRVLLGQTPEGADALARYFDLTPAERRSLVHARPGEGLLFVGRSHVAFEAAVSRREYAMLTTRPADLLAGRTGTRRPIPGDAARCGLRASGAAALRLAAALVLAVGVGGAAAVAGDLGRRRRRQSSAARPMSPTSRPRTSRCTRRPRPASRSTGRSWRRSGGSRPTTGATATAARRTLPAPRARCSSCPRPSPMPPSSPGITDPDICDPVDAIPAAAAYLSLNGAPKRWDHALYRYNPADWYPPLVMRWAVRYGYGALGGLAGRRADLPALRPDELHRRAAPLLRGHLLRALPRRARHRGAGGDAGPGDGLGHVSR